VEHDSPFLSLREGGPFYGTYGDGIFEKLRGCPFYGTYGDGINIKIYRLCLDS